MWEYNVLVADGGTKVREELNAFGKEGWELVSAVSIPAGSISLTSYIFKRPGRYGVASYYD